jgi:adenylosuccinate synthase
MPNTVLMGAQWGDEGKGKIIDVMTKESDVVVRYQGGNNAGHTVKVGDQTYVLHLLPSGILHPGKVCVIGNGLVIDPMALMGEIDELEKRGISAVNRLFVSDRAHVVFPYHRMLDAGRESRLDAGKKIGTTQRGIGPAYADKVARTGIRMGDLVAGDFQQVLASRLEEVQKALAYLGLPPVDTDAMRRTFMDVACRLTPYVCDTIPLLNRLINEGKSVLFEGAQGTMLDVDFGTYPFVTSSSATAGGASVGTGVPPHRINRVVGVIKAYTTRVGEGPFPTELNDATGEAMRKVGHEFGATTGRPRRCGWFDAVVGRYSAMVNGCDYWAMTKLDVLDSLPVLRICTAYECDGRRYENVPADPRVLARCKPVYEEMPGWQTETSNVSRLEDLPPRARAYVDRLCALTGVKLGILSVGPGRHSTIRVAC